MCIKLVQKVEKFVSIESFSPKFLVSFSHFHQRLCLLVLGQMKNTSPNKTLVIANELVLLVAFFRYLIHGHTLIDFSARRCCREVSWCGNQAEKFHQWSSWFQRYDETCNAFCIMQKLASQNCQLGHHTSTDGQMKTGTKQFL